MIDEGPNEAFRERLPHQVALFIQEFRAVNLVELQRHTGATYGALQRALRILEEGGVIQAELDGIGRRIYSMQPAMVVPLEPPLPLRGLEHHILRTIASHPNITASDIASKLNLPNEVVEHLVRKLQLTGFIEQGPEADTFRATRQFHAQVKGRTTWRTRWLRVRLWMRRHLWLLVSLLVLLIISALVLMTVNFSEWHPPEPEESSSPGDVLIVIAFLAFAALIFLPDAVSDVIAAWRNAGKKPCCTPRKAPRPHLNRPQPHRLRVRARRLMEEEA